MTEAASVITMLGPEEHRMGDRYLQSAGYPLLLAEMPNRVAYPEAGIEGLSPTTLDPDGAAARDIAALAHEIMKFENHEVRTVREAAA